MKEGIPSNVGQDDWKKAEADLLKRLGKDPAPKQRTKEDVVLPDQWAEAEKELLAKEQDKKAIEQAQAKIAAAKEKR